MGSTTLEYTPTDTTDMLSQRSTTDFTTPTLEFTILASVKQKLTLNSHTTTTPMLDTHTPPDILDIPDTLDTPPHTPTATCGTDTTTKNQDLKYGFFLQKNFWPILIRCSN